MVKGRSFSLLPKITLTVNLVGTFTQKHYILSHVMLEMVWLLEYMVGRFLGILGNSEYFEVNPSILYKKIC